MIDAVGLDRDAEITFVAVPVLAVADQVKRALAETSGVVTDVGSVKAPVCDACDDPRFVGGHPMAGSELDGLDGADGDMFNGADLGADARAPHRRPRAVDRVGLVKLLGAEVVALAPDRHDQVVAVSATSPTSRRRR